MNKKTNVDLTKPSLKNQAPGLPFGYVKVNGELVEEPREQVLISLISEKLRKGETNSQISTWLNDKNIPTKLGSQWNSGIIGNMSKRGVFNKMPVAEVTKETSKKLKKKTSTNFNLFTFQHKQELLFNTSGLKVWQKIKTVESKLKELLDKSIDDINREYNTTIKSFNDVKDVTKLTGVVDDQPERDRELIRLKLGRLTEIHNMLLSEMASYDPKFETLSLAVENLLKNSNQAMTFDNIRNKVSNKFGREVSSNDGFAQNVKKVLEVHPRIFEISENTYTYR